MRLPAALRIGAVLLLAPTILAQSLSPVVSNSYSTFISLSVSQDITVSLPIPLTITQVTVPTGTPSGSAASGQSGSNAGQSGNNTNTGNSGDTVPATSTPPRTTAIWTSSLPLGGGEGTGPAPAPGATAPGGGQLGLDDNTISAASRLGAGLVGLGVAMGWGVVLGGMF